MILVTINTIIATNRRTAILKQRIDKLKLILKDHQDALRQKRDWINPLALFITLLVTNLTSTFNDTWSISADTWKAIFIILCLFSACWLAYSLYHAIKGKQCTIDTVINTIKIANNTTEEKANQYT